MNERRRERKKETTRRTTPPWLTPVPPLLLLSSPLPAPPPPLPILVLRCVGGVRRAQGLWNACGRVIAVGFQVGYGPDGVRWSERHTHAHTHKEGTQEQVGDGYDWVETLSRF